MEGTTEQSVEYREGERLTTDADKGEVLVRVEGLSKKFCRDLKRSLWYGVQDMVGEITRSSNKGELRRDEFWAVRDINFELRRGECLGLIGHNGAGKSTLLKMLNGLIKPDQGRIEMNGKVGALIELGAGFNPVLTGRENVYINGQILGFTKKEIDEKYEAIVAFAELQDFMETPVQSYSSGMKVRLGFAIAAQMEPDILIIDEVLAVGDVSFRVKCFNAINEIVKRSSVIFVSHTMPQISKVCTHALLLKSGKIQVLTIDIVEAIKMYYSGSSAKVNRSASSNENVSINELKILNGKKLRYLEDINLSLEIELMRRLPLYEILLTFFDEEQKMVAVSKSEILKSGEGKVLINAYVRKNIFSSGKFMIGLRIHQVSQHSHLKTIVCNFYDLEEFTISGVNLVTQASFYLPTEFELHT